MDFGDKWNSVIFSDEKKFNLNGPDNGQYYWYDTRKDKESFFMRQSGGGSVMIFAAFSSMGKSEIAFLSGRVCSNKYISIMEGYFKPFASQFHGIDFVYQQDNTSIHVSQVSRRYFSKENIRLLPWPARSPDLNPI